MFLWSCGVCLRSGNSAWCDQASLDHTVKSLCDHSWSWGPPVHFFTRERCYVSLNDTSRDKPIFLCLRSWVYVILRSSHISIVTLCCTIWIMILWSCTLVSVWWCFRMFMFACDHIFGWPYLHVIMFACDHGSAYPCLRVTLFLCDYVCVWLCIRMFMFQCDHVFVWACICVIMFACDHVVLWSCFCVWSCFRAIMFACVS